MKVLDSRLRGNDKVEFYVSWLNQLEALKGERKGQYSIRINDQFRVCFTWAGGEPGGVEIVDYH